MDDLRSFEGGKMRMQEGRTLAADMLPDADEDSFFAGDITGDDPVYLAGDVRANENPNLLSMQAMFVHEHNCWADRLAEDNPDWDDDQRNSAARSIAEFELQQITYNEWLPHLIGDAADQPVEPDAVGGFLSNFQQPRSGSGIRWCPRTSIFLTNSGTARDRWG